MVISRGGLGEFPYASGRSESTSCGLLGICIIAL